MFTDFLIEVIGEVPAGFEYIQYVCSFILLTVFTILTIKFFLSIFSRIFK